MGIALFVSVKMRWNRGKSWPPREIAVTYNANLTIHIHNDESKAGAYNEEQRGPSVWFPSRSVTLSEQSIRAAGPAISPLPNEIVGLIVDELRDDTTALRACSTVSSLFCHFCKRHLYQSINLDTPVKVDGFIFASEDTDLQVLRYTHTLSLGIAGMASWRYADKLVTVLGVLARKASIKCLSLKEMKFTLVSRSNVAGLVEAMGILSRTVSKLKLSDCLFIRREDIESLLRSFPLCKSLRLRRCAWQSAQLPQMFPSLPIHTVSLDELEITTRRTLPAYDLSGIVEQDWLDTAGLKSLTYSVIEHSMATKMFDAVQDCRLEKLRISCRFKESYPFGNWFQILPE